MPSHLGKYRLFVATTRLRSPGVGSAGFIIIDPYEKVIEKGSIFLGLDYSNGRLSYLSIILGLERFLELHVSDLRNLELVSDSRMVVKQIRGESDVQDVRLKPLYDRAIQLLNLLPASGVIYIPRKYNREASALAAEAASTWRSSHLKGK